MAEVPAASSSRYQTPPSDPAKTNTILSAIATPFGKILAADAAFQPGGTLEDKRKAILRAVGDIPIVTSEFFFDSVLSWSIFQARPELLDEVEQELINNQHLANGSWVEYPVDPNYMQGTEDIVFAGLSRIMDAISVATRTVLERYNGTEGTGDYDATTAGLRFLNTPHANPKGERLNATRPDGSGVLTEADWLASKILDFFHLNSWFVMGVPSEFKKKRKLDTILDNMKKVFWSVTHIFANDPARRFTYAFTAEDASMIMWFMSRSQIMASERFNFRSSPKQLIRLVAALALASPEQLGFDPTVSQCRDAAGIVQYKIEVDGKYYSTIGTVSDYLADDLRGRGTRVLLVHPEGDPTTVLTLKDTWMMADSVPEGELLHLIHKLLENEPSDAGRHPSQFFLSVERDGFVLLADGTPDTTEKIMGGKMIPLDSPHIAVEKSNGKAKSKHQSGVASASLSIRQSGTGTVRGSSKGFPSLPPPIPAPIQTKRHDHRKHYRLVTNEVGQSIDELTSLCQILHALADIVKALKIFHGLGLVHRDLSPGNILVVDGIARLTDLEHTKVFRSDARAKEIQKALLLHSNKPKGDKNANYDFMAVEAQDGRYKFCPAFRCDPKTDDVVDLILFCATHKIKQQYHPQRISEHHLGHLLQSPKAPWRSCRFHTSP
ncbi:hypothetical protein R3P38DRAFT_315343 [Favolaschia claudopus]|uniref:Fungal-type protein kinase domain-containing protein n=1 Tax=Favolaschia claudopus TaxID=2862362 RepID=A0AAW0CTB6_9AGAR